MWSKNGALYPMQSLQIPRNRLRIFKKSILGMLLGTLLIAAGAMRAGAADLNAEEQQLAARLTSDRGQRRDRSHMRLDPILTSVARARAEDMATRRYFSHVNPDGIGPNFLVRSAGYALPPTWAGRSSNFIESIGAGYASAEQAWEGWMNSPSHRTHLLASSSFYRDQTNFGIGSYTDPSSPFRRYWVIITAPPTSRAEPAYVSRRSAKPARVAVAMPVFSNVDPDDGEVPDTLPENAPRPTATRAATVEKAGEKLWNWEAQISAPRPRATRGNSEG
jgi:uncharacterized protein YkwD